VQRIRFVARFVDFGSERQSGDEALRVTIEAESMGWAEIRSYETLYGAARSISIFAPSPTAARSSGASWTWPKTLAALAARGSRAILAGVGPQCPKTTEPMCGAHPTGLV